MATDRSIPDFGATLRDARERRGLTLRVIADTTKISVRALEALERNDIARLPAGIFSRAFVRAYASEVGLDPEQTIADFITQFPTDSVTQGHPRTRNIVAELESDSRRGRWPSLVWMTIVGVAVLALLAYSGVLVRRTPPVAVQPVSAATDHALSAAQTVAPEAIVVSLQASRPTTLSVAIDGAAPTQVRLEPGSPRDFVATRELLLTPADPLAFQWSVNGHAARALTGPVRLTPDTIQLFLAAE